MFFFRDSFFSNQCSFCLLISWIFVLRSRIPLLRDLYSSRVFF